MNSSWTFEVDTVNRWAYLDKVFSKEECEAIINCATKFRKGKVAAYKKHNKNVRDSGVFWISPSDSTEWIFRRLVDVITNLNRKYFGFELFGMLEGLQLTKYEAPGGFYDKHVDREVNQVIRKLSVTVQLSDPSDYEGGDLLLYFSKTPEVMDKGLGKLIAFPSYTLHEVTPVTKGTRYSLVVWITGSNFR
jgi:PKHD-type hydroxylase